MLTPTLGTQRSVHTFEIEPVESYRTVSVIPLFRIDLPGCVLGCLCWKMLEQGCRDKCVFIIGCVQDDADVVF